MRVRFGFAVVVVTAALVPVTASADVPYPSSAGQANPYAYQDYLWAGGTGTGSLPIDCTAAVTNAPNGFDCNNYKLTSRIDPTVEPGTVAPTAQELGGVMGPAVDQAWDVTTGRPDTHVAVLDSGIKWQSYDDMVQLRNKVALNWAELPAPELATGVSSCAGTTLPPRTVKLASPGFPTCYDVNHDGVLNMTDFAADPRLSAPNHTWFCSACGGAGKGLLTPEDLIEVFTCWNAAVDPAGTSLGKLTVGAGGVTTCSNGAQSVDNDGNGFPHDIAGWNFMEHTNNPIDEPAYSHGTGEAKDSTGEANIGSEAGTCPSCMVIPLKVGDSFIADVNDFAQAVLYATDNQVNIVQEALGTLNNSSINQAALDYAYNHGVTVISSAADEEASHHNQPASSENHAIVVNSSRLDDAHDQTAKIPAPFNSLVPSTGKTYLSLNGCTNYGGRVDLTIPSVSCSSEATGKSSGMAGLIISEAKNLVAQGLLQPAAAPSAAFPDGVAISPDEVKQVLTSTADDIDFEDSSPPVGRGTSPADHASGCTRVTTDTPGQPLNFAAGNAGSRFFSIAGWDQYTGYGRVNASCAVRAVLLHAIPPTVDITSPRWFGNVDPQSAAAVPITGTVSAPRASSFTYKVQVAYGVQPHENDWTTLYTSPTETSPVTGTLATLSPAQVAAVMPAVPGVTPPSNCAGHAVDPNGDMPDWLKPPYNVGPCQNYWDEYTFSLRIQATDNAGRLGEDRRSLQGQHDSGAPVTGNGANVAGFPRQVTDQFGFNTDGASDTMMADLLGDNQNELVFGTSSGLVHAMRADGSELPGFPVHGTPLCASQPPDAGTTCAQRTSEPAFDDATMSAVMQGSYAAIMGSVAVGDLDHSGKQELVFADMAGYLYAYEMSSTYCAALGQSAPCLRPGFPAHENFGFSRQGAAPNFNRDEGNRVQFGFIASPTLADLDGDGRLEVIAGGLDRNLYAWQPDGTVRPGFPVLLAAPEYVSSINSTTDRITYNQQVPYGTKIMSSPAIADLNGDGKKEIVLGRNEEYTAAQDGGINASIDSYDPALAAAGSVSVGGTQLFNSGNGRVYAVYSDGANHPAQQCNAAGHGVPTNAYVCNWPAKVLKFDLELLPEVGSGVDTPPAIMPASKLPCPGNTSTGDRVGVFTSDGPAYIFGGDGTSCYGQAPNTAGKMADRVLGNSTVSGNTTDTPYLVAVGDAAFGDLTGTGQYVLVAPTAGLVRSADIVLTDHQYNGQNGITAWGLTNASTGAPAAPIPEPTAGFPHFMDDLSFFGGPAVADLSGAGTQQVIAGSAVSDLRAVTATGAELPGFSKNTGGWIVETPSVGTVGTDQNQKVAVMDREGTLFLWETTANACSGASWPRYKHDNWNSGNYTTDASRPATITNLQVAQSGSTVTLTFTAPHGDLFCGNASGYQVRYATSTITDATWAQSTLAGPSNPAGCTYTPQGAAVAGSTETITLTNCPTTPLAFDVQAYNAGSATGGNLAAISSAAPASNVPEFAYPSALLLGGFAVLSFRARRRRRAQVVV